MKRRVGQNKVLLLDKSGHPKTWDWIYLLLRLISLTISFYISQVRDIFCQKKYVMKTCENIRGRNSVFHHLTKNMSNWWDPNKSKLSCFKKVRQTEELESSEIKSWKRSKLMIKSKNIIAIDGRLCLLHGSWWCCGREDGGGNLYKTERHCPGPKRRRDRHRSAGATSIKPRRRRVQNWPTGAISTRPRATARA